MSEEMQAQKLVLAFSSVDREAASKRVGPTKWRKMEWVERLQELQEPAGKSDAGDPQNASTPSTPNNADASENFDDEEDPQKASIQEKEEEVEHEFKLQGIVKKEKVKAQRSAPARKKEEEEKPPLTPNNAAASKNYDAELKKLENRLDELEKTSKPERHQPFRIAHDDHYRTLAEHALDPKVGSTETVGASLMNQIKLPECVNTSVWLTPLIDSRMWYGEPEKKFVDLPLHLQEKYATKELKEVFPAAVDAEEQFKEVRRLKQEIQERPGSHTQDELVQAERELDNRWKKVEEEMENPKCNKPDQTNKLFEDFWDRPNMYGLTPAQALLCLYIPTIVSYAFVLFLQFGFIFYIQEVVRGKREEAVAVAKSKAATWTSSSAPPSLSNVCYGSKIVEEWDSKYPAVLRIICLLTFLTEVIRELSECVDMRDWVGEVPVFQAPKVRTDCMKWKEVKFGSNTPEGKEIINTTLSALFQKKLEDQTGRELRWVEVSEQPTTGIVVKDLSKNKALSHALSEKRLKFTKEEFEECFKFPMTKPKFSYDSYMKVGDTFFRPSRSLTVDFETDFTKGVLKKEDLPKEAKDILENNEPKKAGYVKAGTTYFVPVDLEPGHGLTWKYHEYETGKYKVANGQVVELTVRKPVTGISNGYRCFIYLVIMCKGAIASVLCYYGAGWILFGNDEAGDLILNTLASSFIFSVGDIVYSGFTSKLGKAMCDPDRHIIQFCAREPSHKFSNRRNMVSWFVMAALLLVTTVALDTQWGCSSLIDWGFLGPVGRSSVVTIVEQEF